MALVQPEGRVIGRTSRRVYVLIIQGADFWNDGSLAGAAGGALPLLSSGELTLQLVAAVELRAAAALGGPGAS